ncbi:hypothetical protein [Leptospira sp. GIMC2001]|uniref:hypothetical protein n=1 Tax=Leptospira sp. GIMC2001 TaxID=1513297 RepID=UPI00234BE5F8|nr:hypothetical protein [Leptospira sp. GIMC2001]WCL50005.1 hypothetical protein O4O04_04080 [Leptospira sp. GIMC2001]
MKKVLLLLIVLALAFTNCRNFMRYAPDSEGGVYRNGSKTVLFFVNSSYLEHCKNQGGKFSCTELDVDL